MLCGEECFSVIFVLLLPAGASGGQIRPQQWFLKEFAEQSCSKEDFKYEWEDADGSACMLKLC